MDDCFGGLGFRGRTVGGKMVMAMAFGPSDLEDVHRDACPSDVAA